MKIGGGSGNRVSPPVEPPKNEGVAQPKTEKTSDSPIDLEKTQDIYVDPKALRKLGIGAGAVAVGAGVAAGAIVGGQKPVDPSYFDHLNIRDKPINETAIGMVLPPFGMELAKARLANTSQTEALLFSRIYQGSEAVKAGFLAAAVPQEQVLATAMGYAEKLKMLPRQSFAESKIQLRKETIEKMKA